MSVWVGGGGERGYSGGGERGGWAHGWVVEGAGVGR